MSLPSTYPYQFRKDRVGGCGDDTGIKFSFTSMRTKFYLLNSVKTAGHVASTISVQERWRQVFRDSQPSLLVKFKENDNVSK